MFLNFSLRNLCVLFNRRRSVLNLPELRMGDTVLYFKDSEVSGPHFRLDMVAHLKALSLLSQPRFMWGR